MPRARKRQAGAGQEETSSQFLTKQNRSVTIHPRVSHEEQQIVKALSEQVHLPAMTIWGDCASDGLILLLIKQGPDDVGIYGGRWTAKKLAQIARRRILTALIDFQAEQDELPTILKEYINTLKALAEKQGIMLAGTESMMSSEEPATEEDELVFSSQADPADVTESLGGMGFGMIGLPKSEDGLR